MDNKQLYTISNQQRFTFNSWKVIVPYSHVHFPVYLTNPYQLTYRRAAYIRAYSYNYSIGQQTFTFDMGVHLKPTLPNIGLYNQEHKLPWSHTWSSYPSMNTKVMYENNYNNCNLPYLPASKYTVYNNSGNRVFYDLMVHSLYGRYYNKAAKSYVTNGLDNIISYYTPLTAGLLSHPSCIYYLLSPQLYQTLNINHKGQIKTPMIYLRSLLHEYIYTTLWSINFAQLWIKLCYSQGYNHMHLKKLTRGFNFSPLAKVNSLICDKYVAIMRHYPAVTPVYKLYFSLINKGGVLRVPITQSLTFLSSLQVSIPHKRLWGMGSWGRNYLGYYAPRRAAGMHGTGITCKLPMNKYTRVTGAAAGGRAWSSRLYKGLLVLPFAIHKQPSCFSYARILQFIAPACYHSGSSIVSHHVELYSSKQLIMGVNISVSTLISLWTHVWVKLYKQSLLSYTHIRVTRKQRKGKNNMRVLSKKQPLTQPHKLWYNRMLPKKSNSK